MPKALNKPDPKAENAPARVAVVGGGLAGMTAALRLAQRGFSVTLYEANDALGGNLSSDRVRGVYHDVYPHMFCAWYANFWDVFEHDLGLSRDAEFEARAGVKMLNKGSREFVELENATTLTAILKNLNSGLASWPDLFLLGFSMLDLAATPLDRTQSDQLEHLDVNGFIYSRGYATQAVATLQNYILMVIWSIESELTAAASYQDFIKHTVMFPRATPFAYLLKGSLYEKIIRPLQAKLNDLGCEIRTRTRLTSIELIDGAPRLTLATPATGPGRKRPDAMEEIDADYVVMATTAEALSTLALSGEPGRRIVDRLPDLAGLRRLWSESIPVLDLYFNKKLPDIPKEMFALAGTDADMTVLDLSQLWTGGATEGRTAFTVAASNRYALPATQDGEIGHMMIKRLHEYLPVFKPGERWGDPDSDIDWSSSHFRSNDDKRLFVNEVGTWGVRPVACYPEQLPNVFFAGDYCQTDVDMATMEAAVQSGILAAQALQAQEERATGARRGQSIEPVRHEVYSDGAFLAAKLALLPFAYAAAAVSAYGDAPRQRRSDDLDANVDSTKAHALLLPLAFTLDWWKTAYWLARRSLPGAPSSDDLKAEAAGVAPSETPIGAGAKALSVATDFVRELKAATRGETPKEKAAPTVSDALAHLLGQAWRTAEAAYVSREINAPSQADRPGAHRRRWRMKP